MKITFKDVKDFGKEVIKPTKLESTRIYRGGLLHEDTTGLDVMDFDKYVKNNNFHHFMKGMGWATACCYTGFVIGGLVIKHRDKK